MNQLPENINQGTFAEILVQLLLLKYGVQAAPPIKDSGNDLIAVSREEFRAVQVKSFAEDPMIFNRRDLPDLYHVLALVRLDPEGGHDLSLDRCRVFLLPKEEVTKGYWGVQELVDSGNEICLDVIDTLFNKAMTIEER